MKFKLIIITLLTFFIISQAGAQTREERIRMLAEAGEPESMVDIGIIHENNGEYKEAVKLYKDAAKKNSLRGKFRLGRVYYYGLGEKQDYEKALMYLVEASNMKIPEAQVLLGKIYEQGLPDILPRNTELSNQLYIAAGGSGNPEALQALKQKLPTYSGNRRLVVLEMLVQKGNDKEAATELIDYYFEKDKDRAVELLENLNGKDIDKVKEFIRVAQRAEIGYLKELMELASYYAPGAETFKVTPTMTVGPNQQKYLQILSEAKTKGIRDAYFLEKDYWLTQNNPEKALEVLQPLMAKNNTDATIEAALINANYLHNYPEAYRLFLKTVDTGETKLRYINYGERYLSIRGTANVYNSDVPVAVRIPVFDKYTGQTLKPGMSDYSIYAEAMAENGEF